MRKCTVMFAGGGTGGHLTPGIAVSEELGRRDPSIDCIFVGSDRPIEREIITSAGFTHVALPVQTLNAAVRNPFRFAIRSYRGLRELRRVSRHYDPAVVVGLGGFASGLPIWFSRSQGIPTVLLEQNIVAGRMTRLLAKNADAVCTSFPETDFKTAKPKRVIWTGNPIRADIAALHSDHARSKRQTLLILGGSQGATAVNDCVVSMLPHLKSQLTSWEIVHQTGVWDEDRVRIRYEELGISATVAAFYSDLSPYYANAGLAITRAGATTLSELACAGVPSILVPYPTAKDDHQRKNARFFADAGAAEVCEQAADPKEWIELTQRLLCDSSVRAKMRQAMKALAKPNAASLVADIVGEFLPGR